MELRSDAIQARVEARLCREENSTSGTERPHCLSLEMKTAATIRQFDLSLFKEAAETAAFFQHSLASIIIDIKSLRRISRWKSSLWCQSYFQNAGHFFNRDTELLQWGPDLVSLLCVFPVIDVQTGPLGGLYTDPRPGYYMAKPQKWHWPMEHRSVASKEPQEPEPEGLKYLGVSQGNKVMVSKNEKVVGVLYLWHMTSVHVGQYVDDNIQSEQFSLGATGGAVLFFFFFFLQQREGQTGPRPTGEQDLSSRSYSCSWLVQ